ncbi:MAG TPA: DUF305 domain-containing protein [Gemmatimonadales bacterium]|nr:DUF305 domain-containing protein [Gemmatimonadales bacterium]
MPHRSRALVALGVGAVTGAALATLVLTHEHPTNSAIHAGLPHHAGSVHHDHGPDSSTPTFYSEMTDVSARMHDGMAVLPSDDVDRDFMRMMIPHHQGAIDMALVLLKYGHDEKLKRLAQSIIVEQGQEIAYMHALLDPPRPQSLDTDHIAGK